MKRPPQVETAPPPATHFRELRKLEVLAEKLARERGEVVRRYESVVEMMGHQIETLREIHELLNGSERLRNSLSGPQGEYVMRILSGLLKASMKRGGEDHA